MVNTNRETHKQAEYVSDVIVDLIKAYNIEYVAFNPGSSFRGIHDSLVNYGGNTKPEIIECCHEEVAISMAHGYAKATGRPMVAVVHDTVGLQHATMAIYNAWCDRVPMIVLGGNGPLDITKRRPRGDWAHTALIPGNLVRDYVKWDDQPHNLASVPESFIRAYKIAMTPPRGPVYISYDVGLQEDKLAQPVVLPDVTRYEPPTPIQANEKSLRQAAQWLVEADNPVILTDFICRNPQAAESLVELAELLAIPVLDSGYRINLLPNHPLNVTGAGREIVEQADVVLALDAPDTFVFLGASDRITRTSQTLISPNTRVIQISLAELLVGSWSCDYHRLQPADLNILADTSLALPQLVALCQQLKRKDTNKEKYSRRFERIHGIHDRLRATWREQAAKQRDELPIAVSRLCTDIWEVIRGEDWVLVNNKVRNWEQRLWDWDRPNQWLGHSGAGGLGYGIGASLGAALAYKGSNKLCIDLESDGEFLYNASALWTAAHYQIPLLVIMFNNRSYYNSEQHCQEVAKDRGRSEDNRIIGNRIEQPPVDFARLAQSFGVYGEGPVEKPDDIIPAVERAMKVVAEKKMPALVDIVTQVR